MPNSTRSIIGLILLAALVAGGIAVLHAGFYGLTIFIVYPVLLGALGSWVFQPASSGWAGATGAFTVMAALFSLLFVAIEGVFCVLMVLPLAMPLGALGGWLAYRAEHSRAITHTGMAMLLLVPPTTLAWDTHAPAPVFEVRSAITIDAPPERVWQNVVSFRDLPEPPEWFFRAGLAYPKRARIVGSGVGATRYCEFSTCPFVEPIEVWDQPRLLRFRVTENPAPLRELSLYPEVLPKHLHGYLVSKHGQFRLTSLPVNRTLLEGTTWYQHGLWPAFYWRWWSDAIIHRIHLRVLNHIRALSEQQPAW